jgi:uncharacterized protein
VAIPSRSLLALAAAAVLLAGCGGAEDEAGGPQPSKSSPFAYDASAQLALVERGSLRRAGLLERELAFAVPGGPKVAATLVLPARAGVKPGIVYLHGAGGSRRDMLPLARRLARRGAVALALEQPEPGTADAGLTGIAALEAQADLTARAVVSLRRALDVLASLPAVDDTRLGAVGWSGGGRITALAAGVEQRLDAVVLMSVGALPVSRYVDAAPTEFRAAVRRVLSTIDPLRWLRRAQGELLLQNGRRDEIVPRSALAILARAAPRGKDLRWYDTGHALNEAAYQEQADWLVRVMRLG